MRKILSIFAALSLSSVSAVSTVSCSSSSTDYFDWINGIDVVNYTSDITRNKSVKTEISSTSTDVIATISGSKTGELVVIKLNQKMNIFWSYRDNNSLLFATNNLTDYSTWNYVIPQNSAFAKLHSDLVGFTSEKYQYIILDVAKATDVGEIIQIMNDDNEYFSFAINLEKLSETKDFEVDLNELSTRSGDDPVTIDLTGMIGDTEENQTKIQTIVIQSLMESIIKNGLMSTNPNVRYLNACASSLAGYTELASEMGTLFSFPTIPWTNIMTGKGAGEYAVDADLNADLVSNLINDYKPKNKCTLKLKIIQ